MSNQRVQDLDAVWEAIEQLKRGRVTHRKAQVTGVDVGAALVHAVDGDGQPISARAQGTQLLPTVGQWVLIRLEGATPLYEPAGIAEDAVTGREIAPGTIPQAALASDLIDQLGGAIIHRQATQPAAPPAGREAYWWQPDGNGVRLRQYNPGTSAWDLVQFGNGAVVPKSLIASNVFVDGTVSAELLEARLALVTAVIAGDEAGIHALLDGAGIGAYATDPDDGLPTLLGRFGQGWSVADDDGNITASATEDGQVSSKDLNVQNDPVFQGIPLSERLWDMPWGKVPGASFTLPDTNAASAATSAELGFGEISFEAQPGRAYVLRSDPFELIATTAGGGRIRVRRTTDGSTPSTTTSLLHEDTFGQVRTSWTGKKPMQFQFDGPTLDGGGVEDWRLLLSYAVGNGSLGLSIWQGEEIRFWVEDIGPASPDAGVASTGGGTATTAKVTRTVEYGALWTRSWRQNNTTVSNDDAMYQGYGDSVNGIQRSAAGWPDLTSVFSGATINSMYIYMYAEHWQNPAGGTLNIGYHNILGEPATAPGALNQFSVGFTARGQGKWIRVDPGGGVVNWTEILKSGVFRGISISAPNTGAQYYGRFSGASLGRPRLRVTYTK